MRKIIAGLFIMPLMLTQARAHLNGVVALRYTLGHRTMAPVFTEVAQCAI
jgi:hypothetical protein